MVFLHAKLHILTWMRANIFPGTLGKKRRFKVKVRQPDSESLPAFTTVATAKMYPSVAAGSIASCGSSVKSYNTSGFE